MNMTPGQFAEARALWAAALEQPPAQREAFLQQAAPDDAALRAMVMELLETHNDTNELFSRSFLGGLGLNSAAMATPSLVGRMLGAYRVTREIGHGGMGTVYEAERADEQFDKRVAIKTLRHGAGTAGVLERFARERQIQAALAHPNIATLLDAGVTDDAIPFIVLEYIDGLPIDAYCDTHRLTLSARLDLFQQVVKAVQHAHRQLVVHRDLKPTNILVTEHGVVKLLDFGISKLLDSSPDHAATEGPRAFTTAYASPEQIRGGPVSTSSDVYSLGVVLYRLLTGKNPFDLEHTTSSAAWTIICEDEPQPPSAAVTESAVRTMGFASPMRLANALKGELDAIVLMALRKEPERRYATADAMGEDVLNHLRGRPVNARPDSTQYRVYKFVSRNRLATAAMAVAFVAMGAGMTVALWQARVARQASAVAESQRLIAVQKSRTAERVSKFLQEMFSAADRSWAGKSPGPNTTIAEVIDAAAERVDRDLANEPIVAEALHQILLSTYSAMQNSDKGLTHARRVLGLMRARNATGVEIARGLQQLGTLQFLKGDRDSALVSLRESYALFAAAGFPETEDFSVTLNQLGLTLWDSGKPAEAEPYLRRALAIRKKIIGDDVVAAIISSNLGLIRDAHGDLDGAEAFYRQGEAMYAGLGEREYFEHGYNLNNLAIVLLLKGELPEAERLMRRSLDVMGGILGTDHVIMGLGRINLARIELAKGQPTEALATFKTGQALLTHLPPEHADVARTQTHEANILLALGRTEEAEQRARTALATRTKTYPSGDWRIAETQSVLGRIRLARGATAEGRDILSESRESFRNALGESHPRTLEVDRALATSEGVPAKTP